MAGEKLMPLCLEDLLGLIAFWNREFWGFPWDEDSTVLHTREGTLPYDKKRLDDWVMAIDLKNPAATFNFKDWEVMTAEPSPISLIHESANIRKERAGHKHKHGEKTTTPKPRCSHRNAPVPAMGSLTNDRAKQNNSPAKSGSSSGGVKTK